MNMRKQTWRAAVSAAAICVATALPSWANTAVWKSNADGNLSDAANWVDGYVPQAGDTIDFRNVTATHSVYNDLTETVQYETVINHSNVMFRRREGCSDWCFAQVTFNQSGSNGGLGGGDVNNAARLTVAGRLTIAGETGLGNMGGRNIVSADEIVKTRNGNIYLAKSATRSNLSVVKARQFVHGGTSGYFALGTKDGNSNYGLDIVVGSGGFQPSGAIFFCVDMKNTTVIHPSADYTLQANQHSSNVSLMLYAGSTLKLDTTDYNDGVTPRTVTLEGGIGARKNGSPYGKLYIIGTGTVDFNSCLEDSAATMPATTVSDTATVLVKDTSIIGNGAMSFAAGTTLKVVQTSPTGIVELGGALTLAANSILDFDLAANSITSALKVASLALPASGTVKVKLAESDAGRYTLVENLPNGTTVDKFSAVNDSSASSYLTLYVEDDKLIGVISKKAIWKSNADGNLSDAANWVDGYVPQAGDTIDFSVITTEHSVSNDLATPVTFETMTAGNNTVVLRRRQDDAGGGSEWVFNRIEMAKQLPKLGIGTTLRVLDVLKYDGPVTSSSTTVFPSFGGNNTIVVDKMELSMLGNTLITGDAVRQYLSKVIVGGLSVFGNGSGYFGLSTFSTSSGRGVDWIVGEGGMSIDGAESAACFFAVQQNNNVVIHPSADFTIGPAVGRNDNLSIMLYKSAKLVLDTTDYNDGTTPRTITLQGGVGARNNQSPRGTLDVKGCGTVDFTGLVNGDGADMAALTVQDTATILVKDTSAMGSGAMSFAAGTTLKVAQTSATGIVELGGALTLAANSTLDFDLAANSATSALKVASLTMPASGKVRVKVSGVSSRGKYVLIDNLPAGISAKQFELVENPFDNATLVVRNNQLRVEKRKGLMIIVK